MSVVPVDPSGFISPMWGVDGVLGASLLFVLMVYSIYVCSLMGGYSYKIRTIAMFYCNENLMHKICSVIDFSTPISSV